MGTGNISFVFVLSTWQGEEMNKLLITTWIRTLSEEIAISSVVTDFPTRHSAEEAFSIINNENPDREAGTCHAHYAHRLYQ